MDKIAGLSRSRQGRWIGCRCTSCRACDIYDEPLLEEGWRMVMGRESSLIKATGTIRQERLFG